MSEGKVKNIDKTGNAASEPLVEHNEVSETTHAEQTLITTNDDGKRVKRIIRRKRKPARVQIDPADIPSDTPTQTGTVFNIWYNKWSGGDREDKYLSKTHAINRCNVKKDAGYTRADSTPGAYICLHFARGMCYKGQDCEYLHRLPTSLDIYSGNVDCFGREKHSDYRDDMGGVGTFSRQNRTIYVGRIHPTDDIEEVVARHFAEWGPIERIRCLPARGVAFVTFQTEAHAQFAREAMAHQSLDHDEVLNCRWATVDPNPASQKREARKTEEQAADAIRRILPAEFVKEIEGDHEAKRRRVEQGNLGLEGYSAPDSVWYSSQKAVKTAGGDGNLDPANVNSADDMTPGGPADPREQVRAVESSNGGLLSSSTLAALTNYNPRTSLAQVSNGRASNPTSLVPYDSDDDD